MRGPSEETIDIALKLAHRIGSMIIEAIQGGDLETIKKVTDILPDDQDFLSRSQVEIEREKTRRKYED
jgi:hypothetical protein